MANLRRTNTISVVSGNYVAPGAGYFVNVYAPGAVARGTQTTGATTTVIPVYDGSGFAVNEYAMKGIDTTKVYLITAVDNTAGAATITVNGTVATSADRDVFVNIGADTGGGGTPTYIQTSTANAIIYYTPDTSEPITNSKVTCDASGDYGFYYAVATNFWEVIRNTAGTAVGYFIQNTAGLRSSSTSTDNRVVRWDGATGLIIQDGYTNTTPSGSAVSITDGGVISATAAGHTFGSLSTTSTATIGTNLTVNGNATLGDAVGDTTAIAGAATVGSTLTVAGATSLAAVTASGAATVTGLTTATGGLKTAHIDASLGSLPTVAVVSGWGTVGSPTAVLASSVETGTDVRATVVLTSGSAGTVNPAIFDFTFATAFSTTPWAMVVQDVSGNGLISSGGLTWVASPTKVRVSMLMAPGVSSKTYIFRILAIA